MGKLVPQLPRVITFVYDLRFRRVITYWKDIFENDIMLSNFDFVYSLIVVSPKNTVQGPKTTLEVHNDVIT
jgi:hypothetical protein